MSQRSLFSVDHELFRENVRRYIETDVMPYHADWEKAGRLPKEAWLRAGAAGVLGCDIPEAYGGAGGDFLFNVIVIEEFARAGLASAGSSFMVHSDMVATYLDSFGTEEQKQKWLPGMCAGEIIGAVAMTEPSAGSDLKEIKTTAEDCGDHFILSGQKTYISNGQNCDLVIVACKTDPKAGARGVSLLLLDTTSEGFVRGKQLEKIGLKGQDTSELFFDNIRVPKENLLGVAGGGFSMLMTKLSKERLVQAVRSIAVAEQAIKWTVDYARDRQLFGKKLSEFQNTRFVLAELSAKVAAGRALVDHSLRLLIDGKLDAVEAAKAKLFVTDLHCEAVDRCLQIFGGYGYMTEYPIARAYVDARVVRIAGGSAEVMKEIIGRDLFKP